MMPNIPLAMKFNLRTYGGDTLTWDRVKEVLTNVFAEMKIWTNQRNQRERNNSTGQGNRNDNEDYIRNSQNRSATKQGNNSDTSFKSSDVEESHMMMCRIKEKKQETKKKQKAKTGDRPISYAITISIPTESGRKSFLGLINTGTSSSLASRTAG